MVINKFLWKWKKSLWFRADSKNSRDYYETNVPTFRDVLRYAKKGYALKFWVA